MKTCALLVDSVFGYKLEQCAALMAIIATKPILEYCTYLNCLNVIVHTPKLKSTFWYTFPA